MRLSGADVERFTHEDMASLRALLEQLEEQPGQGGGGGRRLFHGGTHRESPGDLRHLRSGHGAFLIVDDCHGFGVLGRDGCGTADHFGLTPRVDLLTGSFSKSLASTGVGVAGDRSCHRVPAILQPADHFQRGLAPAATATALASLRVMQREPEHIAKLWENTHYYQSILKSLGLDYWDSSTPAVPIVIGDKERCYFFLGSRSLSRGFFTVMSIFARRARGQGHDSHGSLLTAYAGAA